VSVCGDLDLHGGIEKEKENEKGKEGEKRTTSVNLVLHGGVETKGKKEKQKKRPTSGARYQRVETSFFTVKLGSENSLAV
jgi:hypothetical protein